jgi:hypothetical protein
MFNEHGLGDDGTQPARSRKPDHGDDHMEQKDKKVAHPGIQSNLKNAQDFSAN